MLMTFMEIIVYTIFSILCVAGVSSALQQPGSGQAAGLLPRSYWSPVCPTRAPIGHLCCRGVFTCVAPGASTRSSTRRAPRTDRAFCRAPAACGVRGAGGRIYHGQHGAWIQPPVDIGGKNKNVQTNKAHIMLSWNQLKIIILKETFFHSR